MREATRIVRSTLTPAVAGTEIALAQRGKIHRAKVSAMPFVPHHYVRKGA